MVIARTRCDGRKGLREPLREASTVKERSDLRRGLRTLSLGARRDSTDPRIS